MKVEVSFVHPDKDESDYIGDFEISEERIDWSQPDLKEIQAERDAFETFSLPNGELLKIKSGCCETNFTISITQNDKLLVQLISTGSGNLIFPTLAGGMVFFEMYFTDCE